MDQLVTKPLRGFAAMTPEKRREIAAKGGAAVPHDRRSFSQSNALAKSAGAKGGAAVPKKPKPEETSQENLTT